MGEYRDNDNGAETVSVTNEVTRAQPEGEKKRRTLLALIIVAVVIGILLAVSTIIGVIGGSKERTFVASGLENVRIDKIVDIKVKAEIDAVKKLKEKKDGTNGDGDDPGDDPDETPKEDPTKDPNNNGENGNGENGNEGKGNGDNGGTGQVWHPAWDEWVVSGHYETRYIEHPAVYGEVFHPAQGYYAAVCNTCGAIFGPGLPPNAAAIHLETYLHDSYKNNVWIETSPPWVETIVITAAWTEAVQVWIDTSHWVRHEGYWQ